MLKVILVFVRYFLLGLGFLLSPVLGAFYLLCVVGCFVGNVYSFRQWYVIDVAIATIVYGTHWRTISGITGEKAFKEGTLFWKRQEKFIDFLAELVGDRPKHCYRAYLWEKESVDGVD